MMARRKTAPRTWRGSAFYPLRTSPRRWREILLVAQGNESTLAQIAAHSAFQEILIDGYRLGSWALLTR